MQARQWLMGKAQPEKYSDIKTIRDERHPLDAMTEEERMQATIELVEKVKARLDQARALACCRRRKRQPTRSTRMRRSQG